MKLLFDQNLSFRLCQQLADIFPGSEQIGRLGLASADDRAIWDYAGVNGFAVVTLDGDFAELGVLLGPPPKVIWLRCGNQSTSMVAMLLRTHFEAIAAFEHDAGTCLEIYDQ